jgi:hypothetical protein
VAPEGPKTKGTVLISSRATQMGETESVATDSFCREAPLPKPHSTQADAGLVRTPPNLHRKPYTFNPNP